MEQHDRRARHESRAQQALRSFARRLSDVGGFTLEDAERAAAAVLCAMEQLLAPRERADLEAQLPANLVELMHRCPFHEFGPRAERQEFLELVAEDLGAGLEPERCARAVFQVVSELVSAGEVVNVVAALPASLRELWPQAVLEAALAGVDEPDAELEVEALRERAEWDALRDAALQLPLNVQLGLFQALAGPLLRALDPAERRSLLHALQQAAQEITEDENALEEGASPM